MHKNRHRVTMASTTYIVDCDCYQVFVINSNYYKAFVIAHKLQVMLLYTSSDINKKTCNSMGKYQLKDCA